VSRPQRFGSAAAWLGRTGFWIVASLAVWLLALRFVGIGSVVDALATADRGAVAGAVGAAVGATIVRAFGLRLVLDVLDAPVSTIRALALYVAATFVNTVTPSG